MDCNSCKESRATVSMAVFDRVMLNHNAIVKRLVVIIVLLIVLLVGSNAAWLWYESQFVEEVTETVETSTEGGGNAYGTLLSGDNNEVNYGESENNAD